MAKVTFFQFAFHPNVSSRESAQRVADRIEGKEFAPGNNCGERYYKSGGWCYDIGRKPFLIQHAYGGISRGWALSVSELREAFVLKRADKVVPDPFYKKEVEYDFAD